MLQKLKEGFALLFWNPLVDKAYKYVSWYTLWNHAWKKVQKGLLNRAGIGIPIMYCEGTWGLVTAFETCNKIYHMYLDRMNSKYCIVQKDGIVIQFDAIYNLNNPEYKIQQFCNRFRYNYMIELAATGEVKKLDNYISTHWKEIMTSMHDQIESGALKAEDL